MSRSMSGDRMGNLFYDDTRGEGWVMVSNEFMGTHSTMQIDILTDWMYELEIIMQDVIDCQTEVQP